MSRFWRAGMLLVIASLCLSGASAQSSAAGGARVESDYARLEIGADGKGVHLVDKRHGMDRALAGSTFARIIVAGRDYGASAVEQHGDQITVAFPVDGARAVLRATAKPHYIIFEVLSVSGPDEISELALFDIALKLKGMPEEPFGACALALNLKTNVQELPGFTAHLRASCYRRFGFEGARAAIVACPADQMRAVLKEAVQDAPELPHSTLGGPWALDAPVNYGSYLFNFGDLSESTVDEWIALARRTGMTQIDFHGGNSFRFGDFRLNPQTYPRGEASLKAVIDRLHAAGIQAGLHTYAFFIDKRASFVTPVPDARLSKDSAFTLAEPLAADAAVVPVLEATEKMSTITGFFVQNSVTLQIDDELITYAGINKRPPYTFTGCQRGALGTKAVAHARGAKVHHLKECFGLFVPDGESSLFTEVAARTAEMFNRCGFDMIYLDALDGEGVIGGPEAGWHYGSRFAFEIAQRLQRPALMEMSTFHHHLWYLRSRYCAWDHSTRGHKRFVDVHCASNDENRRMFMPNHLGWYAVKTWSGPQGERTFEDDVEYLCCKCIGTDAGFALQGIDVHTIKQAPALERLAPIMQRYEALRHRGAVPASMKAKLRQPGAEFRLEDAGPTGWQFRPMRYDRHKVDGDERTRTWTVRNDFGPQPAVIRIEVLNAVAAYDSPDAATITDFSTPASFAERSAAPGLQVELTVSDRQVKVGQHSGVLRVTPAQPDSAPEAPVTEPSINQPEAHVSGVAGRAKPEAREPSAPRWANVTTGFGSPLNLTHQQGLGLWVHGDGGGELLNLQLRSPAHVSNGIGEHYVDVDFTGWRYVELVEAEGLRCAEVQWPYGSNYYGLYREAVDYAQVQSLGLWLGSPIAKKRDWGPLNGVPRAGAAVNLSPIKALPLVPAALKDIAISIGGRTIQLPAALETGSYLEARSVSECKIYGQQGQTLAPVTPQGDWPTLQTGDNQVRSSCTATPGVSARAYVTIISQGEPLADE